MEVDDLKLLRLDVLENMIKYRSDSESALTRTLIDDHRKLLKIAALVLDSYEHYAVREKPVEHHDDYDTMMGPRWSALRQLVCKDL